MLGEPLLAHPAEIGGVHSTRYPHPGDDDEGDQRDGDADDDQHMVLAGISSAYDARHIEDVVTSIEAERSSARAQRRR